MKINLSTDPVPNRKRNFLPFVRYNVLVDWMKEKREKKRTLKKDTM